MKKFKLVPDQIIKLIELVDAATATDMITVEGRDVGYMYREISLVQGDTGWRFFPEMKTKAILTILITAVYLISIRSLIVIRL